MKSRREFLEGAVATASLGLVFGGGAAVSAPPAFLRSALLHLSMNMWGEFAFPGEKRYPEFSYVGDRMVTETAVWNATIDRMVRRNYNHVLIDVGDGVVYPSHPELAIKGRWTPDRLRDEVRRLRALGIEAVPKLNFSASHDGWLKQYGRMLSTRKYYQVVRDVIADTCEIFENPRLVHVGLDEEETIHITRKPLVQVRRGDLWWHDAQFLFDEVVRHNARPACFGMTAYLEYGEATFLKRMPRMVVQCPSLYGSDFDFSTSVGKTDWFSKRRLKQLAAIKAYVKGGFDCFGGTSAWVKKDATKPIPQGKDYPLDHNSAKAFLGFLRTQVPAEKLIGMMSMPWEPMTAKRIYCWESGIDELADALDAQI